MSTPERDEFEKWWPTVGQTVGKVTAWLAWQARQSEIDTLKDELALCHGTLESRERNIEALKAENDKLRKENAKIFRRYSAYVALKDDAAMADKGE